MKKILGVFSLIAILTVSFTAQASSVNTDDNVEVVYDIGNGNYFVAVDMVNVEGAVFNVADVSVSYTVVKEDTMFNDGSVCYVINSDTSNNFNVPIDYGIRGTGNTLRNIYTKNLIETRYTDAEEPVGWNTKN